MKQGMREMSLKSEMKQIAILFLGAVLCLRKVTLVTNVRTSLDCDEMGVALWVSL